MAAERLQKIIAAAGIASRRKAEELIAQGRVTVNGQVITEPGSKADPERDHIKVDGKLLHGPERHIYLLLNKPRGYVTTVSDPQGRPTVMDLVKHVGERIYPVGRLDYASEGLLLLTNDGALANFLTSAASHVPKTYLVKVAGQPAETDIDKLRHGIRIGSKPGERGVRAVRTAPAQIRIVREADNPWYEVTLIEGKHRQIRRMFEEIGHNVEKIKRVRYGPLSLDVEPGKFRELTPQEVASLRSGRPQRAPAVPSKSAAKAAARHIGKAGIKRRTEERFKPRGERFPKRPEREGRPRPETAFPTRERGPAAESPERRERGGKPGFPQRKEYGEPREFRPRRERGGKPEFLRRREREEGEFPGRRDRAAAEFSQRGERGARAEFPKRRPRPEKPGFPRRKESGEAGFQKSRGRGEREAGGFRPRRERGPAAEFPKRRERGERSGFPRRRERGEAGEQRSGERPRKFEQRPRPAGGVNRARRRGGSRAPGKPYKGWA